MVRRWSLSAPDEYISVIEACCGLTSPKTKPLRAAAVLDRSGAN